MKDLLKDVAGVDAANELLNSGEWKLLLAYKKAEEARFILARLIGYTLPSMNTGTSTASSPST